jgi:hypothetical protein
LIRNKADDRKINALINRKGVKNCVAHALTTTTTKLRLIFDKNREIKSDVDASFFVKEKAMRKIFWGV